MLCNKIVIIGAGLMGASLYEAVRKKLVAQQVVLMAKNTAQIKILQQSGITNCSMDYEHTKNANLIIIATPLHAYEEVFNKLLAVPVSKENIIIDIGSVKEPVTEMVTKKFNNLTFIATHPITGSQKSGVGSLVQDLYEGSKVIITSEKTAKGVDFVAEFWRQIGMNIAFLDAKAHDNLYAHISHLVQKIAFNIKEVLAGQDIDISVLAKELNNKEFYQFTRLTASDSKLWEDIFNNNVKFLSSATNSFLREVQSHAVLVQNNQFVKIYEKIQNSKIRVGETVALSNDFDIPEQYFLYYMFGAIIASSLIYTIKDQMFFDYAGPGFKDIIAIKNTIRQQDILKFTKINYNLTIMLREFCSNFK